MCKFQAPLHHHPPFYLFSKPQVSNYWFTCKIFVWIGQRQFRWVNISLDWLLDSLHTPPTPHTPPPLGYAEPFVRMFIQEGLTSIWDFGWELALQVGVIFFRWDLKTPCIKNSEYKSQAKKKKDSNCNFYNFSLLVPQPNKFVVVCICIFIFHGIYSPLALSTNIFFMGAKFCFCVLQQGAGNVSNFLGTFRRS